MYELAVADPVAYIYILVYKNKIFLFVGLLWLHKGGKQAGFFIPCYYVITSFLFLLMFFLLLSNNIICILIIVIPCLLLIRRN